VTVSLEDRAKPHGRPIASALLIVWVGVVAVAVFSPTSRRPSSIVADWIEFLGRFDLPARLTTFGLWEAVFNVVMFVPAGLLGPLAISMRGTWRWLAAGLLGGTVVELVQAVVLTDRQASIQDVLTNALGVLLGYWMLVAIRVSMTRSNRSH